MGINRDFFFDQLYVDLYPNGLQKPQMDGHSAVLDAWEAEMPNSDDRWLAYMLGTAYHETGQRLQPVRETFATSNEEAAARLETAWKKGQLPWVDTPYWRKDADGKYWFGRGLVQLTHKTNYEYIGPLIHEDLVTNPDNALNTKVAIEIMFYGMIHGSFTRKWKLADFFHDNVQDWTGARQIINGSERAALVAGYARSYYAAISYTVG